MRLLTSWRFWVGLAVSVVCLWLALRDVPFGELGQSLAGAGYAWLLPGIVLQFVGIAARSQRWVVLLGGRPSLAESFWSQGIGYLFTNVLPFRVGEPVRVAVMSARTRLPIVQVAASAVVERLLDVATIVVLLALVLPWMQVPQVVARAGLTFGGLVVLAVIGLPVAVRYAGLVQRLILAVSTRLRFKRGGAVAARWSELVDGLTPMTHWRTAAMAVLLSAATWVCSTAMYWFVLRAFQPAALPVEAAFMVVALAFAVTVPSSPGFIGVFQFVGQQALVLPFGAKYDPATALAITLVTHLLMYYFITTSLGVVGLWRLGVSFAGLGRTVVGKPAS